MHRRTEVEKSEAQFDLGSLQVVVSPEIRLDELQGVECYQQVTVSVKVVSAEEESEVKRGLRVQEYTVGDATGAARLTVWEKNVGVLKVGACYRISGLKVRNYNDKKFLSMPEEDCEIAVIADIGDVEEELGPDDNRLEDAVVIGVMALESYTACFSCKGKIVVSDGILGKCSKCAMTLRADRCTQENTAKLVIEGMQMEKRECVGT